MVFLFIRAKRGGLRVPALAVHPDAVAGGAAQSVGVLAALERREARGVGVEAGGKEEEKGRDGRQAHGRLCHFLHLARKTSWAMSPKGSSKDSGACTMAPERSRRRSSSRRA